MKIENTTGLVAEAIPFKGPDRKAFLTVVVKGTFVMPDGGTAFPAEEQTPITYGDEPFDKEDGGSIRFESDLAPFKPRADVIVVGHAHAPGGKPVTGIDVSLRIDSLQKVLRVFGDRVWQGGAFSGGQPSPPTPFLKMPLVYERAFGGIDTAGGGFCARNLVGCGFFKRPTKKSVLGTRLPNIEDPRQPIRTPKDQPRPAGYGVYGRAWEPRVGFLGTYDDNYRKNIAPDPPPDFKYDYFNAAHPDLQLPGYLNGDESVELINLSPEGTLNFRLPGLLPSCEVTKTFETLEAYLETLDPGTVDRGRLGDVMTGDETPPLNLDTLYLMPDEKRVVMVWRGRTPVYDHTALEVGTVKIGFRGA